MEIIKRVLREIWKNRHYIPLVYKAIKEIYEKLKKKKEEKK